MSKGTFEKGKLIIYKKHGEENQQFKIRQVQNGKYYLLTKDGKCLEVPKSSDKNGVQITCKDLDNDVNEFWEIIPAKGGPNCFYIKSFCGKALDVEKAKAKNNADVIQYDFHGNSNQIWHIQPI